jgi:hypothetical protein
MTYMVRRRPGTMGDSGIDDFLYNIGITDRPDPSDNVNQTASGGTTTSAADFTTVNGVCKPQNFPALAAARAYQGQLNRVAQAKGFPKIATDGAIGPGTLALHKKVQSVAAGSVMGDPSSCMGVAPDVDILASQVKDVADALGVPATVPGPVLAVLSTPTIVTKSGKVVAAPDASGIAAFFGPMSGVEKLAIVGVAGAIGYLVVSSKKRRRR